jgi:hypothetical protein
MTSRCVLAIVAVSSAFVAACAAHGSEGAQHYNGMFSHGFEADVFIPCGSREQWWAVLPSEDVAKYDALVAPYEPVFVRVRGRITDRGPSGHLGRYDRYLHVDSVLNMQPAGAARC